MTRCPHGLHSDPATCSQCRGVKPRIVQHDDNGRMIIDGRKNRARPFFMPSGPYGAHQRRGGLNPGGTKPRGRR